MKYSDFANIMSNQRMSRYHIATGGNTRKAMTLYRLNLKLSQELFTIVSCFEVALRNAIDKHYTATLGNEWLLHATQAGGIFDNNNCRKTADIIRVAHRRLSHHYTHYKLVAEMDFGFWRYLFAQPQFAAGRRTLLHILPGKPKSTAAIQYNNHFVFNELEKINSLRNRIAHHEPVCFQLGHPIKDTTYAQQHYALLLQLFQWMGVNEASLLDGIDKTTDIINKINAL